MTIYNLGSINADYFYRVPHFPAPGETLSAESFSSGLGGKGANQSVAAAKAGTEVIHIGAVGPDGDWAIETLGQHGVKTDQIAKVDVPTAHAIITLDPSGENQIVLFSGANAAQDIDRIEAALSAATSADTLLLQNETSHQVVAAEMAVAKGMRVVYSAAPFELAAIEAVLPYVTLLSVNEVEAEQLMGSMDCSLSDLPVEQVLVTKGSKGATLYNLGQTEVTLSPGIAGQRPTAPLGGRFASARGQAQPSDGEWQISIPSFQVDVVDTTGAGDTFTGVFAAGLDLGRSAEQALKWASATAALKVMRAGTADAIPSASEVEAFLKGFGANP
jgi:ribokinase